MDRRISLSVIFVCVCSFALIGCGSEGDVTDQTSDATSAKDADVGGDFDDTTGEDGSEPSDEDGGTGDDGTSDSGGGTEDGGGSGDATDGGGDTGGGGGLYEQAAVDFLRNFAQHEHEWACKDFWGCPDSRRSRSRPSRGSYSSLEACRNATGWAEGRVYSKFDIETLRDLQDGRLEFDSTLAASCLTEIRGAVKDHPGDCSAPPLYTNLRDECSEFSNFLEPTSGEGEPCRTNRTCTGDLDCERPEDACGGQCKKPSSTGKAEGEECSAGSFECGDGLVCAPDPNDPQTTVCAREASRSAGEICSGATGGGLVCKKDLTCAPDLQDPDRTICIQQGSRTDGQLCSNFSACAQGLVCGPEKGDTGSQVCFPEESRAAGEACSANEDCQTGTVCRSRDTCEEFRVRSEGESCDTIRASSVLDFCGPGLTCVPGSGGSPGEGSCKAPKSVGESCSSGAECTGSRFAGETCVSGSCTDIGSVGASCGSSAECMLGSMCGSDGECKPRGRMACWP